MTFFIVVMSFGTYLFYGDATADMNSLDRYSAQITDKGITTHSSSTKFGTRTSDVFFIRLEGLDQILATYNRAQDYGQLEHELVIGDSVTVYYRASLKTNEPNINTYQIEKNGKVVLDNREFRSKSMKAVYIGICGIVLIAAIGIVKDRKYWN